jgi:hypothetical protein
MIIFEEVSKKMQGIIQKYLLSKKSLDKAQIINNKCREVLINEACIKHNLEKEKIVLQKEKIELAITGALRGDTSWAKAWKDFDTFFYPLLKDDEFLSGEYLRARRKAELDNKKSPQLRWEIRPKGGGNGT